MLHFEDKEERERLNRSTLTNPFFFFWQTLYTKRPQTQHKTLKTELKSMPLQNPNPSFEQEALPQNGFNQNKTKKQLGFRINYVN